MTQKLLKIAVGLGVLLMNLGCNHLFYYPARGTALTPDQVGVQYTDYWLTTEDGVRLHAWHLAPSTPRRDITVVHFHGNAENMTTHFMYVAWLTARGFDVVTFDYRGYGSSEGDADREGLLLDGKAVIAWLASTEPFRSQSRVVLGQSLGGAVALPAIALSPPGLVRAIAVESTFESYRSIARGKLAGFWLTWPLQYPLSFLVSDEYSPIDYVTRLDVPIAVIHSDKDPVVPSIHGRRLYEALRVADKEYWDVPYPQHTGAFVAEDSPFRDRLVAFFCRAAGRDCDAD